MSQHELADEIKRAADSWSRRPWPPKSLKPLGWFWEKSSPNS